MVRKLIGERHEASVKGLPATVPMPAPKPSETPASESTREHNMSCSSKQSGSGRQAPRLPWKSQYRNHTFDGLKQL